MEIPSCFKKIDYHAMENCRGAIIIDRKTDYIVGQSLRSKDWVDLHFLPENVGKWEIYFYGSSDYISVYEKIKEINRGTSYQGTFVVP
ncbi:hypothetical protein [Komagataeibacter sp. FNDCF1]|uniref:hypothetical protein n=1 Tax=Komagataeibacter sp. FNDCF1 TaxID=2878681 RepID=UPI001E4D69E1|nr:hypothetical protein [Komagataeibacter sp. FNDCF1]MCE2566302.1 hypothetical protein [Komagataeibacter sp. FNDCF1]